MVPSTSTVQTRHCSKRGSYTEEVCAADGVGEQLAAVDMTSAFDTNAQAPQQNLGQAHQQITRVAGRGRGGKRTSFSLIVVYALAS